MIAKAEERTTPRAQNGHSLLQSGDRMDQKMFHELYKQTPDGFKAELIGGIVYVASPVSRRHGKPHSRLAYWLETYECDTPGVETLIDSTTILDEESELQPDIALRIEPEYGGQSSQNDDEIILGSCELVVEIAHSSYAIDTHNKKDDYFRAGVVEYLIVKVKSQAVVWFIRGKSSFVELQPDANGLLKSRIFPGLWLDPTTVFERSAKRLRATLERGLATPEHAAFVKQLEAKRAALAKKKPKRSGGSR